MKKMFAICVILGLLFCSLPIFAGGSQESTETAVETGRPFEGTELSIIVRSGRGTKELLEDYADEIYEKTGITFKIPDLPYSKLHDQLITDFVSGAGSYDVLLIGSSWVGEMENYLEPLDPYIERDGFDLDDYFDNLLEFSGLNSKGQRIGIPNKSDCMTFYYRTDIIEELGLGDPSDWDWDDFIAAEKAIQDSGLVRLPFITAGVDIQLVKLFYANFVPYNDITTADGRPLFNSQDGVNALERIKEIFSYSTSDIYAIDNNDASNIFYTGEAAMLFNWPVAVKEVNNPDYSDIIGKWAATAPPGPGNIGSDIRSISALSKKKDAAWALVSWLHSAEMTQEIVKYTGQMPGRKSISESQLTMEYIPGADGVSQSIQEAYIIDTHSKVFPNYFQWFVDVGKQIGKYLTGTQSVNDALTAMENTWNEVNKDQIGKVEVVPFSKQK
jgi:multiple sugar transport system substrate-binding protein